MKVDRELHHFITQKHRFRILQSILEHTEQLPTLFEISQFCPEIDEGEVESYVEQLRDRGLVEEVVLPEGERKEGYPHVFYGISGHGWRFLMNHDLLDSGGLTQRWQEIAVDDPMRLAKHQSAPRPDDVEVFQGDPVSKSPEQQLEEYKMVVEQTSDALYMLDADGRYVLVNEAYESLTGYSREDLIGSSTAKVLDPEDMAERRELIVDLLDEDSERQSHAWQSTLHTENGDQVPVEVNFSALEYSGEFIGIVGSARDISDRKRRQQELSVLSRVLRHNLGNKVNIIQGYVEIIEQKVADEDALEYTNRIQRTADRLISQSEKARDIHDLLQEWPPERRPVDVTTVIWNTLTELEMEFPDATFEMELPDSAWARLPDEFEMALEELVRNAAEHAEVSDPTVRVVVDEPQTEGGDITVRVEDDGPGIPDHEIEAISADRETPLSHSEGLGLWMVTWIVNAADGELSFGESDLGGTRTQLRFPAAEPPALTLSM
jgi:PAS domain S-box-containing protein